jgi:hypothetical protein
MGTTCHNKLMAALVPGALLAGMAALAVPTAAQQPGGFADEAFRNTWTRTDLPVQNGTVKRSYYWGPQPDILVYEDYLEGTGGKRLVQYFDKSRMEINNPSGNRNDPFFVTNGLLAVELITGRVQVGNNIASDVDDVSPLTPTYASFRSVYDRRAEGRIGETVLETINRFGQTGRDSRYSVANVRQTYYETITGHNIPDVFWNFLNLRGPVVLNGRTVEGRLSDPWFYATGYPITEAYWARVKIAGVSDVDVLIQAFERRVLTYVPTAPEGFKVQMGNIGAHYRDWRYSVPRDPTPPPLPTNCTQVPVRGFGKVWADQPQVRTQLGCPYGSERQVFVAQQSFEGGQMIDVIERYGTAEYKTIYVLFGDGSVQRFQDTYRDGDPEPTVTPPPPAGRMAPVRGFGKVWREGTGARVRERLGWATGPEIGSPEGAILNFQRGTMVYAGPQLKKIYVLYGTQPNAYEITRWSVFDDTYRP